MKLGIIGVGHLAGSILKGLLRAGVEPSEICLSPRGHGPELAQTHGFELASGNEELVQNNDLILLSVRPADAVTAATGLPWRDGQVVMSACAGVGIDQLAGLVAPAKVVRIMPITASELGASPTVVYPARPEVSDFLDAIGQAIPLSGEDQFEAATVSAAIYGWAQELIRVGVEWSANQGLDPAAARQLVAQIFVASGRMQSEIDGPMSEILDALLTPNGITEAGLDHLTQKHFQTAWVEACDVVIDRLRGGLS